MRKTGIFILALTFSVLCADTVKMQNYSEISLKYIWKRNELFRNGKKQDFIYCVKEQLKRYPESKEIDVVKMAYQGSFGAGHALLDMKKSRTYFGREYSAVKPADIPLIEVISPDYCRVNLAAWKFAGLPEKWLFNMFAASAEILPDSERIFKAYILQIGKDLPHLQNGLNDFMKEYTGGAVHHSLEYRKKYKPAYRIVSTRFISLMPVLYAVSKLPEKAISVIAIDGRAASGKTTLAGLLSAVLEADVIHMDDFFLPPELRNYERFSQPGGNVHYERFKQEVLPVLHAAQPFSYRKFDCSVMKISGIRKIGNSCWRIVEGAYSMHPEFGNYADLKIFYNIDPQEQMERIRMRNGEYKAEIFASRWIPMEEKYIRSAKVIERADIVLGK